MEPISSVRMTKGATQNIETTKLAIAMAPVKIAGRLSAIS